MATMQDHKGVQCFTILVKIGFMWIVSGSYFTIPDNRIATRYLPMWWRENLTAQRSIWFCGVSYFFANSKRCIKTFPCTLLFETRHLPPFLAAALLAGLLIPIKFNCSNIKYYGIKFPAKLTKKLHMSGLYFAPFDRPLAVIGKKD